MTSSPNDDYWKKYTNLTGSSPSPPAVPYSPPPPPLDIPFDYSINNHIDDHMDMIPRLKEEARSRETAKNLLVEITGLPSTLDPSLITARTGIMSRIPADEPQPSVAETPLEAKPQRVSRTQSKQRSAPYSSGGKTRISSQVGTVSSHPTRGSSLIQAAKRFENQSGISYKAFRETLPPNLHQDYDASVRIIHDYVGSILVTAGIFALNEGSTVVEDIFPKLGPILKQQLGLRGIDIDAKINIIPIDQNDLRKIIDQAKKKMTRSSKKLANRVGLRLPTNGEVDAERGSPEYIDYVKLITENVRNGLGIHIPRTSEHSGRFCSPYLWDELESLLYDVDKQGISIGSSFPVLCKDGAPMECVASLCTFLLHEADLLDQQARTTEGSKIEKLRFTTKYHMPFSNFLVELKKEYGSGNIETGFKKFTRIMAERGGARAVMSVYAITS